MGASIAERINDRMSWVGERCCLRTRSLAALPFPFPFFISRRSTPSLLPAHANSNLRHFPTIGSKSLFIYCDPRLLLFYNTSLPLFHNLRLPLFHNLRLPLESNPFGHEFKFQSLFFHLGFTIHLKLICFFFLTHKADLCVRLCCC